MGAFDDSALLQRHRITVDEYQRMGEAGLLAPDARVELIEGEVIDMAPMRSRHAWIVNELAARLHSAVGRRAMVTCQTPLQLSQDSEPEPDLMLLRPPATRYARQHPGPADVLLLVEVADTSIRYDREIKAPLYARHGIAELWIVDLEAECVRFYREGDGSRYADVTASETPAAVPLPGLEGVALDLAGLLA